MIILSLTRTVFGQGNLPVKYCPEAVENVFQAKKIVPHPTTKVIPYGIMFGDQSPHVTYIRIFGGLARYHRYFNRFTAIEKRLQDFILLCHVQGDFFKMLTAKTSIIRTRYDKFDEGCFLGYCDTVNFGQSYDARDIYSDSSSEFNASVEKDLSFYGNNDALAGTNVDSENHLADPAAVDLFIYIPETSTNQNAKSLIEGS